MKKLCALLAICFLSISLAGCGNTSAVPAGSAMPNSSSGSAMMPIPAKPEPLGSSAADTPAGSGSFNAQNDPNVRIYRDCTITILGYSLRTDSEGETAVRVEYEFQNNSQKPASFSTTVIPNAYQGTDPQTDKDADSLSYASPADLDAEYSALLTLVNPGESITCAGYFKLIDTTHPVIVEIKDLRDSSADALYRTLDIANMEISTTPLAEETK